MKKPLAFLLLSAGCFPVWAARVDTVVVYSSAMDRNIKTVVVSPDGEKASAALYLLHGHSGDHGDWIGRVSRLGDLVDRYGYLAVCPDGGLDSWYWDTADPNYRYETFVTKELLPYIEKVYGVRPDRRSRAITGLSMGGHGALYLAIRQQDLFAFAGSTSGGVDIRPFAGNWSIKKHIGAYHENPAVWDGHTVMGIVHQIRPGSLQLFIDCGTEDFFLTVNNKLHEKLTYMNVPHHYLTMPGGHDWTYWSRSIEFQMAFFARCFSPEKGAE